MHVSVNGIKLFFDVAGEKYAVEGPRLVERPTVLLLHGGPGFDHTHFKPAFAPAAEMAQLVYLDHRGNGRSEHGDPSLWTLDQWADDVKVFCDTLGPEAHSFSLLLRRFRSASLRHTASKPPRQADTLQHRACPRK